MSKPKQKKTRATIFRIFLFPLIAIMLLQGVITVGTLVVSRTAKTLEEYSGNMMTRLVENRGVILQNDMNQRWASIRDRTEPLGSLLEEYLTAEGLGLEQVLRSGEHRNALLEQLFPECLEILQNNSTTGIFLILAGPEAERAGALDGFYIRDSDPNTNPANYTDLLLERGSKELSRSWGIPMDTNWTTRFHMEGPGVSEGERYFYEPWQAGLRFPDADTEDLGYWSPPFRLEKNPADPHEMITYSIPLRYDGQTYGVLGVEISSRSLYSYFPAAELNDSLQSGYLLAVQREDGLYVPLVGKGMLYDQLRSLEGGLILEETDYRTLRRVKGAGPRGQGVYAVARPLKLYSSNVPYEDTDWVLLGLDTEEDLFGISRRLYLWMVIAVIGGLSFGVLAIYLVVRHLTRPVQRLMSCIREGAAGLPDFRRSNILEVDALYDVVVSLMDQQREAENILLEEKERYKLALESSKDVFFFSHDWQNQMLDIFNHPTMSGEWRCCDFGGCFIDPACIHEDDRSQALEILQSDGDDLYAEFRLKWPENAEHSWVALTGKAIYDTGGRRWKLVGSIRNIQEQKEREAEQLRRNTIDGVTGLYACHAGLRELTERRKNRPEGVMVCLLLDQLKQTVEKNGIVFGDMLLEELGGLVLDRCRALTEATGCRTMGLRLNRDELVLWLENLPGSRGLAFTEALLEAAHGQEESFPVRLQAGLAMGPGDTELLIRRAKLARSVSVGRPLFYRDLEEQGPLPPLQEYESPSLGYGGDVSLVSVALNLFGQEGDFPAQMTLMIRKIGRYYNASGVLVSLLRADFNSNYLNYQWWRDGSEIGTGVQRYSEEEKEFFLRWLGPEEVRPLSPEDSGDAVLQKFLHVSSGREGVVLPFYDNGNYMGNLCVLDVPPSLLEDQEAAQDLEELCQVIQGHLNQQQHDIASRAKSEFLSRMSHEIRTPMNGIIGMTAIALQEDQSPERILDCLQKIQLSSNYLLGLINDILDMSKIESGKMKLEPADFDMQEMLDTVQELMGPQADAKLIDFVLETFLEHRWFRADRMRISQVLINLLGNAVKFTPEQGRITLSVIETPSSDGESLISFAVRDTGVGIAKEEQDRVFRSFEQVGRNPSKQQGTGLGLSISSRLVQLMGSSIQLESALGKGSTFRFTIPLALGEALEERSETEEVSFSGYRILVVEDNELNAEIAQCLLEERGFQVECAGDGAQAVECVRSTPPGTYDVILMDIMMPVMDGLEATRVIRSMDRPDCQTLPIIAMSANAFDDDLKKSIECGMNGHLSKPVEVERLYQVLAEVLRR